MAVMTTASKLIQKTVTEGRLLLLKGQRLNMTIYLQLKVKMRRTVHPHTPVTRASLLIK